MNDDTVSDHQMNVESPSTCPIPGFLPTVLGPDVHRIASQWSQSLLATTLTQALQAGTLAIGSKLLSSDATSSELALSDRTAVLGAFFLVLRNPQILAPAEKQQE